MTENFTQTVAVLGAGTMGAGIAQAVALGGYKVVLFDISQEMLDKAFVGIQKSIDKGVARGKTDSALAKQAKAAFRLITDLSGLADETSLPFVIEAIPEKLDLKRTVFAQLDADCSAETILASNTSSLSISAIAAATQRPEQVIGLHFFNPAHIMKLVEIIRGDSTSDETVATCQTFVARIGKQAAMCKDTPAFIVNRVARPFYGEAFRLLGENAADVETIDSLMHAIGFRMGPFELIDLIGCDVNLAVTQSVYDAYFQEPRYRPHPIQQRMVDSNRLGRKTNRGFYDYGESQA